MARLTFRQLNWSILQNGWLVATAPVTGFEYCIMLEDGLYYPGWDNSAAGTDNVIGLKIQAQAHHEKIIRDAFE